jgi:hypothetical protein
MKLIINTTFFLLFFCSVSYTQTTRYQGFYKVYAGTGTTIGKAVCIDYAQNIYVAGSEAKIVSNTGSDAFLIQLDSTGKKIKWRISIANSGIDNFTGLNYSSIDSTVIVCGYTNSNTVNNNYQGIIAKYKIDGSVVWTKIIGGIDTDVLNDVSINTNGDIYAVGKTTSNTNAGSDVWLVQLNKLGVQIVNKNVGKAFDDKANGIAINNDTLYVVGSTIDVADNEDYYLLVLNTSGDTLYTKTWGSATAQNYLSKCVVVKKGINIAGSSIENNDIDPYTAVLSANNSSSVAGITLYNYSYPLNSAINDYSFTSVYFTFNNYWVNFYNTHSFGYGGSNDLLFKIYDSIANPVSNGKTIGYKYDDVFYNAVAVNDSCFIAVGTSDSYLTNGYTNLIVLKQNIYKGGIEQADSVNSVKHTSNHNKKIISYVSGSNLVIQASQDINLQYIQLINNEGITIVMPLTKTSSNSSVVDVKNLKPGMYFAHIELAPQQYETIKFVIQ